MTRWPEIRAGAILLVIFFGLVDGCPLPPPAKTPQWEKGFVEPIRSVQRVVLRPVDWIRYKLRVQQRWALYQAPSRDRFRLWIEGQTGDGRWHLVFRAGDPVRGELARRIDDARSRGAWDPTDVPPGQYQLFARWVTQHVLDEHAAYVAARLRLEKVRITDDGVEPTGQFVHPYVRLRGGPP